MCASNRPGNGVRAGTFPFAKIVFQAGAFKEVCRKKGVDYPPET